MEVKDHYTHRSKVNAQVIAREKEANRKESNRKALIGGMMSAANEIQRTSDILAYQNLAINNATSNAYTQKQLIMLYLKLVKQILMLLLQIFLTLYS